MANSINNFFPGKISPDENIAGCIDIFENVWPDYEYIINEIEKVSLEKDSDIYWERAETVGSGAFQNIRTNKLMEITRLSHITDTEIVQQIHNQFHMILLATVPYYQQRYGISGELYHEWYKLLKYTENSEYKQHSDSGKGYERIVSALLYLNSDYEGGELEFPFFNIKIKPQPGMLVLFPSNFAYSHIAHPVKSGTKYCLVTWLRDRV
jgi:hypothetical protein